MTSPYQIIPGNHEVSLMIIHPTGLVHYPLTQPKGGVSQNEKFVYRSEEAKTEGFFGNPQFLDI
jgi:hypothetical protein